MLVHRDRKVTPEGMTERIRTGSSSTSTIAAVASPIKAGRTPVTPFSGPMVASPTHRSRYVRCRPTRTKPPSEQRTYSIRSAVRAATAGASGRHDWPTPSGSAETAQRRAHTGHGGGPGSVDERIDLDGHEDSRQAHPQQSLTLLRRVFSYALGQRRASTYSTTGSLRPVVGSNR